jgi:hypothetical protein
MQILTRHHDRVVVELTYTESALIGSSLHLYYNANALYQHPVPPETLELANTFLWQGLMARLETRAGRGWMARGIARLWSRVTRQPKASTTPSITPPQPTNPTLQE